MVQFYRKTHIYPESPPTPLLAFFLRYPNPFARHVLSVDVLERSIDPETGRMRTLRLILKRGVVPSWASRWLPVAQASGGRGLDAWVLEESIVDPPGWGGGLGMGGGGGEAGESFWGRGEVVAERSREVDEYTARALRKMPTGADRSRYLLEPRLRVKQGNLSFKKFMHVIEGGELCAGANGSTLHYTTAEVRSQFGGDWSSMIRNRIESYGVGKFEGNSETSRKGMSLILGLLSRKEYVNGAIDADKMAAAGKREEQ